MRALKAAICYIFPIKHLFEPTKFIPASYKFSFNLLFSRMAHRVNDMAYYLKIADNVIE
jgi:hypothetical protein